MMKYPFQRPKPVFLSEHVGALEKIEASRRFSNYGPVNTEFERNALRDLFNGEGACCTVTNATLGLMLTIRRSLLRSGRLDGPGPRYAIVPAFTFAATAHAALWCGLKLLFCDVDRSTWLPSKQSILDLVGEYPESIAVILPYATFGSNLDMTWYASISAELDIPVVVDAAASLGSQTAGDLQFGTGNSIPTVFSMHATKAFATAEAGLVYSGDPGVIADLKRMANFGFNGDRVASLPGLNGKLSEVGALLCREKLREFPEIRRLRRQHYESYARRLDRFVLQEGVPRAFAPQFMPVVLPTEYCRVGLRNALIQRLAACGIEARTYFSPSLEEHPHFAANSAFLDLSVTKALTPTILSLPIYDDMDESDVDFITRTLLTEDARLRRRAAPLPERSHGRYADG